MPFKPDSQAEPIPGYKLIERLGGGGFGEVWKCVVPGGMFKAIKFVFGNLEDIGAVDDSIRAEQELRSLERIKKIRHPFILTLERYEIIDGQLMIVTELADCSLYDRFRDYRGNGAPGIPREELLNYMTEIAEALDVMTREHDLLHLDIKPQNLFLIYNHIKIGDFGLVKDLEGMHANVTGGVTPVYAAPETFEGYISRFSDQYSLAIVYQELLTGIRPFSGTNTKQLMLQHIQGKPNLDPLPPEDRPTVAKALAKKPTDRWETCMAFVQALKTAPAYKPVADRPTDTDPVRTPASRDRAAGNGVARQLEAPAAPDTVEEELEIGAEARAPESPSGVARGPGQATQLRSSRQQIWLSGDEEKGVLRPTVLVGLGQFGRAALHWLRQEIFTRFGPGGLPILRMLNVDTDATPPAADLTVPNHSEDLLVARLNRPTRYIRSRDHLPPVEHWLDTNILYRMPRTLTTNGIRALGRLALLEHYSAFVARLERDLSAVGEPHALDIAVGQSRLPLLNAQPRVMIVTHLGGGTGSGMFLDCAYIARSVLRKLNVQQVEVGGFLFVPDGSSAENPDLPEANAVAALHELYHFQEKKAGFHSLYEAKMPTLEDDEPPFNFCQYFETPRRGKSEGAGGDPARGVVQQAVECMLHILARPVGQAVQPERLAQGRSAHQASGIRIISSPRLPMLHATAQVLFHRVMDTWLKPASTELTQLVRQRIDGCMHYEKLDPDSLRRHFEQSIAGTLQQPVDEMINELISPFQHTVQESIPDPKEVKRALRRIIQSLGTSSGDDSGVITTDAPDTKVARCLRDAGDQIVRNGGKRLVYAVYRHLDKAGLRFAATEEALQYLLAVLDGWVIHHDGRAKQAHLEFAQALEYLRNDVSEYERLRNLPKWRWPSMPTPAERLLAIFRARYRSMLHDRIASVYRRFRQVCSEQTRNLAQCRSRLEDLGKSAPGLSARAQAREPAGQGTFLLPPGFENVEQAAQQFAATIQGDELKVIDEALEKRFEKIYPQLAERFLASDSNASLGEVIWHELVEYLDRRLKLEDVVGLILRPESDPKTVFQQLYQKAKPAIALPPLGQTKELLCLQVPNTPNGRNFSEIARRELPTANVIMADQSDEIVLYRVYMNMKLDQLMILREAGQEAYQMAIGIEHFTPHCRQDIQTWQVPATL